MTSLTNFFFGELCSKFKLKLELLSYYYYYHTIPDSSLLSSLSATTTLLRRQNIREYSKPCDRPQGLGGNWGKSDTHLVSFTAVQITSANP